MLLVYGTLLFVVLTGSVALGFTSAAFLVKKKNGEADEKKNATEIVFLDENMGLPWPLPDLKNYGSLLIHGTHCVDVLQTFNTSDTSVMNVAHRSHCQHVVQLMLAYFQQTPTYSVGPQVCGDVVSFLGVKSTEFTYTFKYGARRCETEFTYTFKYSTLCTSYADENQAFVALQAHNLGGLIVLEYNKTLTTAEATYMQQAYTPYAIRVGGLGVFCTYGQKTVQTLTSALESSPSPVGAA